jgi:hypothetical protein
MNTPSTSQPFEANVAPRWPRITIDPITSGKDSSAKTCHSVTASQQNLRKSDSATMMQRILETVIVAGRRVPRQPATLETSESI